VRRKGGVTSSAEVRRARSRILSTKEGQRRDLLPSSRHRAVGREATYQRQLASNVTKPDLCRLLEILRANERSSVSCAREELSCSRRGTRDARVHLAAAANRALADVVRRDRRARVDRREERLVVALGQREEDAAPSGVDVKEEGRVVGGCAGSKR